MGNQKNISMIMGVILAVSFSFIILFIEPQFPGVLRYGYLKKLMIWIWLLMIFLYSVKVEKQKFLLWKDKKESLRFYIISIIAIVGLSFLAGGTQFLLPKFGLKLESSQVLKEMVAYLHLHPVLLVFTSATAAFVEELIFRGYLIPRLKMLLKRGYIAVILSALIFGFAHIGYGTLINMYVPFLIGIIFGAYYQKYRNLKVLIFSHFIIDLLSLLTAK